MNVGALYECVENIAMGVEKLKVSFQLELFIYKNSRGNNFVWIYDMKNVFVRIVFMILWMAMLFGVRDIICVRVIILIAAARCPHFRRNCCWFCWGKDSFT